MQQTDNKEDSQRAKSEALALVGEKKKASRQYPQGVVGEWMKKFKVRLSIRGRRALQARVTALEQRLYQDHGGQDHISTAREMLIQTSMSLYTAIGVTDTYLARFGPLRQDQARLGILEFHPIFEQGYLRACQQLRANLLALGLDPSEAQTALRADFLVEQRDDEPAQDPQADGDPDKED